MRSWSDVISHRYTKYLLLVNFREKICVLQMGQ